MRLGIQNSKQEEESGLNLKQEFENLKETKIEI